jgi:hypothetical protein
LALSLHAEDDHSFVIRKTVKRMKRHVMAMKTAFDPKWLPFDLPKQWEFPLLPQVRFPR